MKKLLAIILALVMTVGAVFTMSSCSKDDNTLVCGVTIFENMNEQDENGNWTGFESEFAMEVGKIIGMTLSDFEANADEARARVAALCAKYPLYEA